MPFEFNPELGPERPRTKTLSVSIALHLLVIVLLVLNPGWLDFAKRVIRVQGEDYDLKREAVMLSPPPLPLLPLAKAGPLTAPENAPPLPPDAVPLPALPLPAPPPLPVPPPPPMPPAIIRPDDLIAEGARPDAQPKPSRGNTPDIARVGPGMPIPALPQPTAPPPGPPPAPPVPNAPAAITPPQPKADPSPEAPPGPGTPRGLLPPQIAGNTNTSALRLPSLGGGRTSGVVDNAIQNAVNSPPRPGGTGSARTGNGQGQELPNFSAEDAQILSDTRGYDFGPYLNQALNRIRINWYSLIPESVRFNGQRGRVVLTFTIVKSGAVQGLTLRVNSGADPLDRAAMGSITASNPFPRLPPEFDGDHLTLQITYLYNYPAP